MGKKKKKYEFVFYFVFVFSRRGNELSRVVSMERNSFFFSSPINSEMKYENKAMVGGMRRFTEGG
jgi:hypothetical protein